MTEIHNPKPIVVIESPFASTVLSEVEENKSYARVAMLDSIDRGEAPFAGHLLYTQVLDDNVEAERALGIALHVEFLLHASHIAVYVDYGVTTGMRQGIRAAEALGKAIYYRNIEGFKP